MNERALIGGAFALVAIVGAIGFGFGPMPSLIAVLVAMVVMLLAAAPGMARSVMDRRSVPASAPAVEVSPSAPVQGMRALIGTSIALRLVMGVVLNLTGVADVVAPDHGYYRYLGKMIALSWDDPSMLIDRVDGYNATSLYQHINAVAYWMSGADTSLPLSLMNAFVGTAAAWLVAKVAADIYGPLAGRRAFILAAFFPSLVLWSSLNLRDCWSWLAISAALLAAQRLRKRFDVRNALMLGLSIAGMAFIRPYLVPIFSLGLILSYLVVRVRQLPYALASLVVAVIALSSVAKTVGLSGDMLSDSSLQQINTHRSAMAYGGSAYAIDGDISTPTGALFYLPFGLARFLLAPFPWEANSWREALAVPETFYWIFILFTAIRAVIRGIRTDLFRIATPLVVAGSMTVAYGLVEGNGGTAYRHRAQVMQILFTFAAGDYATRIAHRRARAPIPTLRREPSGAPAT